MSGEYRKTRAAVYVESTVVGQQAGNEESTDKTEQPSKTRVPFHGSNRTADARCWNTLGKWHFQIGPKCTVDVYF